MICWSTFFGNLQSRTRQLGTKKTAVWRRLGNDSGRGLAFGPICPRAVEKSRTSCYRSVAHWYHVPDVILSSTPVTTTRLQTGCRKPNMADFRHLQGRSEEWLTIHQTLPAPANPSTEDEVRALRDATNQGREQVAKVAMIEFADDVKSADHSIPTRDGHQLQARTYRPRHLTADTPLYIHLHGGGLLFGSLDSEDASCAGIAKECQLTVFNLCYRHIPEWRYPTAWNDVEDAFQWLASHIPSLHCDPQQVVLGGISAGAWLTAATLLTKPLPVKLKVVGQILMIPVLVFPECYGPQLEKLQDTAFSSYVQNRDAPILPLDRMRLFSDLLGIESPREDDLLLNPGNATVGDVAHLPPTVLGIAGFDILRDEGLLFAKLLHEAGYAVARPSQLLSQAEGEDSIPTHVKIFPGMPHGFRRFGDKLSECARWDATIIQGIEWALARPSASPEFGIKFD